MFKIEKRSFEFFGNFLIYFRWKQTFCGFRYFWSWTNMQKLVEIEECLLACTTNQTFFQLGHSRPNFSLISSFYTVILMQLIANKMPMAGFEPQISSFGSNRITNCPTTIMHLFDHFFVYLRIIIICSTSIWYLTECYLRPTAWRITPWTSAFQSWDKKFSYHDWAIPRAYIKVVEALNKHFGDCDQD